MPTKNIIETETANGNLSLRTFGDGEVILRSAADPDHHLTLDETDLINAVLEYARERKLLAPLLRAMPQRQRKPHAATKR